MQVRYLSASVILAGLISASSVLAANTPASSTNKSATPTTTSSSADHQAVDMNKVSYSIGYTMGNNIKEQFKELNQNELLKGFQQALAGSEPAISKEEIQKLLINFSRQSMQQQTEDLKKLAETNQQEGEQFLAENKAKPGVITTKSGLQYLVISKGTGPTPADNDRVYVNYTGRLINGEVFSSSQEIGDKPAAFVVNSVIPAWREALRLMPKGSKWEVVAPANLAYGARGTHGKIGPNATLIFTIELLDIDKNASQAAKSARTTS